LDELRIRYGRAGPRRDRDAFAARMRRVGRDRVQPADAARRQHDGARAVEHIDR
jgi:hypothetical protein